MAQNEPMIIQSSIQIGMVITTQGLALSDTVGPYYAKEVRVCEVSGSHGSVLPPSSW
jgi:hypothetical protein